MVPAFRLMLAVALSCFALHAESASPALRLGLLTGAAETLPGPLVTALREETSRLLPLPGLEIHWRDLEGRSGKETFDHLIIVRFHGSCSPFTPARAVLPPGPLGITHISDGQILPFIEANCAQLTSAARRLRRVPFRLDHESLGRALARVVAHEIYHVLSDSGLHDRHGLSKAALTPADLFLPGGEFEPAALNRIAERLALPPASQLVSTMP
jgi:hypothetical protein